MRAGFHRIHMGVVTRYMRGGAANAMQMSLPLSPLASRMNAGCFWKRVVVFESEYLTPSPLAKHSRTH